MMNDLFDISNLNYRMILDYTEKVEKLKLGKDPSPMFIAVCNYIQKHISEPISTAEIAESLFLSRSHLSTKFKEETGLNLTDFIQEEKIEEAKRLLRYSEKSISAISLYLGFSSQSHFTKIFKKSVGKTPREYRSKYIL